MSNMSTSTIVGSTDELSPNLRPSFDGSNTRRGKLIFHQRTVKHTIEESSARVAQRISDWKAELGSSFDPLFFAPVDMHKEDDKQRRQRVCVSAQGSAVTAGRSSLVGIQFRRMLFNHPSHKSLKSVTFD